ncbi:MAG: hypothetical protein SFY66_01655, partial [Oculatellaceae cyanobacterium bins.114]|nr:hypothetical protein [Oculatellaceae cyanobacterium bins.114]
RMMNPFPYLIWQSIGRVDLCEGHRSLIPETSFLKASHPLRRFRIGSKGRVLEKAVSSQLGDPYTRGISQNVLVKFIHSLSKTEKLYYSRSHIQ